MIRQKSWMAIGLVSFGTGCANAPGETDVGVGEVGTIEQASQAGFQALFPLVGTPSAAVVITAGVDPADVEVVYFGDKTTLSGHQPMPPVVAEKLSVGPFETKVHTVNPFHPSFSGGYGAIFVHADPVGTNISPFQTWVSANNALYSVGGDAFRALSYRVPYVAGTLNVVLAITNLEALPVTLEIRNLKPTLEFRSVTVEGLSTFRFNAAELGWDLGGSASINVIAIGGFITLTGYADRLTGRVRAYPVRTGPEF